MVRQCKRCFQYSDGVIEVFPCKSVHGHSWYVVNATAKTANDHIGEMLRDREPPSGGKPMRRAA